MNPILQVLVGLLLAFFVIAWIKYIAHGYYKCQQNKLKSRVEKEAKEAKEREEIYIVYITKKLGFNPYDEPSILKLIARLTPSYNVDVCAYTVVNYLNKSSPPIPGGSSVMSALPPTTLYKILIDINQSEQFKFKYR